MVLGGEEGLECEVCVDEIHYSMSRDLNTWDVFWTNQAQMRQSVEGRKRGGGGLPVLLGLWLMLGVCSLNVQGFCKCNCSCLLLCMAVRRDMEREGEALD